jgi:hypothetical protein
VDDLIKQLTEKTGLGADKVKEVVQGVMDFLGDKLPGPVAGQVKKLLGADDGGDEGGDEGGGLMDKAKGMFGG